MNAKKIFAGAFAASMLLTAVACEGKTDAEAPAADAYTASLDMEDGNTAFALIKTAPRKADNAEISLGEFAGSKVLEVKSNGENAEVYVALDVDALLGEKVTEVKTIKLKVGVMSPDGVFHAVSGTGFAYTGESLEEIELGNWSVYSESKNPYVLTFEMGESAFTAGNDNYFVIMKKDDTGMVEEEDGTFTNPATLYIDDIAFLDAAGNTIEADTTAVMEAPASQFYAREKLTGENVIELSGEYPGDWDHTGVIDLSKYAGETTLHIYYDLENGDYSKDGYMIKLMSGEWGDVLAKKKANGERNGFVGLDFDATEGDVEGKEYHLKKDGVIRLDPLQSGVITVTLNEETMALINDKGGLDFQVFGINVYAVVVEQ